MSGESPEVRPTHICLTELGLKVPTADIRLSQVDHDLVNESQRLPRIHEAGAVERIVALDDRVWFKVKTGRWRGAATRLTGRDPSVPTNQPADHTWWWLGIGGIRREGDPKDFYRSLAEAARREGSGTGSVSSQRWLPSRWDWDRLEAEDAYGVVVGIRRIVSALIARSLRTGHAYQAQLPGYSLTAMARAHDGDTYLIIGADRIADRRILAIILTSVPDVDADSWQPEPGPVFGIHAEPGEVIWSTIIPPTAAAELLSRFPADD